MSGTQSTINDRFRDSVGVFCNAEAIGPQSWQFGPSFFIKGATLKPASIFNKDHPPDKKSAVPLHEFDPTELLTQKSASVVAEGKPESCGLVQRCVIIQRDESGFGLTVSGDNPVFVQLVKEDGAAMRAGVQTGDRIIKVNGTLVTHSNHVEVVKLIKSGSYVALTVLGRPPGLSRIPLSEGEGGIGDSVTTLHSPEKTPGERTSSPPDWERLLFGEVEESAVGSKDGSRTGSTNPPVRELHTHVRDTLLVVPGVPPAFPESPGQREPHNHSPKTPKGSLNSFSSPETEDATDLETTSQSNSGSGSPFSRATTQIIGAEDDYFETEQEQINGQCSCFQNIELLKSRPAHLAAFLHHVVSQFDPAPLLCYLLADLYRQTNSKETRRIFMELHTFFMDRAANLKVAVPESISSELERRRPELIPEELHRHYVQQLQDSVLSEVQRNLEDFRQKRSMGLTLAEGDLARLDTEVRDRGALERERSCAEHIIPKIDDVLSTLQPSEEEKCNTVQYVILSYMKHLGVKVKDRGLEPRRVLINFLKIKKRTEKEGDERVKKPRFPSILGPPRWPVRVDAMTSGRSMEPGKQRPQKQLSQPALSVPESPEPGRLPDLTPSPTFTSSPPSVAPSQTSEGGSRDPEPGLPATPTLSKLSDGLHPGDILDSLPISHNNHCNFGLNHWEHLQEEDRDSDRVLDGGTPKLIRRMDTLGPLEVQSEDDQGNENDSEQDPQNWQQLVGPEVLTGLTPHEIKRQEVINELFYTERAHLRMLKVLDNVFCQKLTRDGVLSPTDVRNIFTNLEEIIQLHGSITEQMTSIRKKTETSVIDQIGDDLLTWFSGSEEEKIKRAVGTFCSNQPFALELIKSRQKKDQRFTSFMQEAESNRLCRRLQLKDIIPVEMQRLTKYPLLLENLAKYTEDAEEKDKVKRAGECCRQILNHVNQAVKESENKQRLEDYQRRLDLSSLKQSENTMIAEFKNLDLTKRKMVHEGPLSWKVNKDKTIELYTLLLEDILVLLQKQDERLILKCHSKNLAGTADTKHIFSPIIKLNTVLVRSVATDNRSFFVLSMSDNGAQIYELMAQTVSEQKVWQCQITERAASMKTKLPNVMQLPQPDEDRESMEMISTALPKLHIDRNSSGSIQSPEKDVGPGIADMPVPGSDPFEGMKPEEVVGREETELVFDSDFTDGPSPVEPFPCRMLHRGSASSVSKGDTLGIFSSRADESLKTLAALKQVLVMQMSSLEDRAVAGHSPGGRLQRTTSLRAAMIPRTSALEPHFWPRDRGEEAVRELSSRDTGFFETSEDQGYLVLEGFGGSAESNTEDEVKVSRKEPGAPWFSVGDTGSNPETLLSSASQSPSSPSFSLQVLAHLRALQANLLQLKDVETRYNQLCQKPAPSTDTDGKKDMS